MAGRPTKYRAEYCEQVIEHMADGASLTSFAAEVGVARSTINEWIDHNPEFREATSIGKAKSAAWWEKVNRGLATGAAEGNATSTIFGLKNMAPDDWHDRKDVNLNHGAQDSLKDLLSEIDGRSKGLPNG